MKKSLFLLFIAVLCSCTYSVYSTGYPHLKSIIIIPFENKTTQYNLEENIHNSLSSNFESDGRLKIVGISPDCQLEGEILDYSNKILSYAGSNVEEYEVRILFKVSFTDLKKNNIILKNDALQLSETYSSSEEISEFKTEEETQEKIINDLFDYIIKESLEEW